MKDNLSNKKHFVWCYGCGCIKRQFLIFILAVLSWWLFIGGNSFSIAHAQGGFTTYAEMVALMQQEFGDLPEFCQCRKAQQIYKKEFELAGYPYPKQFEMLRRKWIRVFKNDWTYLHHYCNGLMRMNEASGRTTRKKHMNKEVTLKAAIGEFDFIRASASRNFPLLYQLNVYEYQIYFQLNEPAKAQRALMRAMAIKKRKKMKSK